MINLSCLPLQISTSNLLFPSVFKHISDEVEIRFPAHIVIKIRIIRQIGCLPFDQ